MNFEWKWQIFNTFNLNISFTYFDLKYSGEACLQERIIINSRENITIGRYCGRRYHWSVFVETAPVILIFHTFDSSKSKFELQYELTDINVTNYILNYKNCSDLKVIEGSLFLFPFTWINKYLIRNDAYYNWNIFVSKMHKLSLKLQEQFYRKGVLHIYDGPDYHSDQYDLTSMTSFTSRSFQVSILLNILCSDIEMK